MVKIGKYPILIHIMNIYSKFGYKDFILALGYKKNLITNYFKKNKFNKLNITLVDTGKKSLTGNRLLNLKKYLIHEDNFFLTYGDGLSNVNLRKLLAFHKKKNKVATLTAVRPPARFGELNINIKNEVQNFEEKNQINEGWINGGFFVFTNKIFNYLSKKQTMLERQPIKKLVKNNQLCAFKHFGFWQCMDTLRDKELLNKIWKSKKNKW